MAAFTRVSIDPDRTELHHHDPPNACARNGLVQDAVVRLVSRMRPHGFRSWRRRLSASHCSWSPSNAGSVSASSTRLGGDPVLYRSIFWIDPIPRSTSWCFPDWGSCRDHSGLCAADHLRVQIHRVLESRDRLLRFACVGAPHVHRRDEQHGDVHLLPPLTFLVSIPSAIKVFNWVATLYKGSIVLEPPMLFILSFIASLPSAGSRG